MKKNKLWVIIVSVLFFSTVLFTGCKNSFIENKENNNESTNTEQTQNTNQNEEGNNSQSDSKIILKNHQKGIEISWQNISAETKIIEICVSYDSYGYTTFTIYDLDQVKSVIDEYVTPGKEYKYTIIFHKNNMNIIERTAWISIVAQNGKGEPDFSIESTEQGSHIIAQRNADKSQIKIQKTDAQNNIKYYCLNQKTGNIDFTDKYVTADSRYDYSVYEEIGNNGEWYNNEIINADPVVRQLRWKTKSVPAIGGVGDIKLDNSPAATLNSTDGSITFTTVPQFSQTPNSWRMSFNYKIGNSNYTLYSIDSEETNTELYRGLQGGLYTFERSPTRLIYDDFELSFDLGPDSLTNIPQTINIIPPDKPVLTATPTDEGILN